MMETIAYISVYLVGYFASYFFARRIFGVDWTVRVRTIVIILSFLSWIVFILAWMVGIILNLRKNLKNESKAKW